MGRRKLNYKEGDWIAVPLRSGGYGIGVVARMDGGGGMLGYFFGPKTGYLPSLEVARGKEASDALLVCKLGDLGLLKGTWKVLGRIEPWRRAEWPIPVFLRTDRVSRTHHKVIYAEGNLLREVDLLPCSSQEAATLPEDGSYGAGAVELVLTKLCQKPRTLNSRALSSQRGDDGARGAERRCRLEVGDVGPALQRLLDDQ